jgi:hypothetical protein
MQSQEMYQIIPSIIKHAANILADNLRQYSNIIAPISDLPFLPCNLTQIRKKKRLTSELK